MKRGRYAPEVLALLRVIDEDDTPASTGDLMDALGSETDVSALLSGCEYDGLVYYSRYAHSWRLTAQGRAEIGED